MNDRTAAPTPKPQSKGLPERRTFLSTVGALAGAAALGGSLSSCSDAKGSTAVRSGAARAQAALDLRQQIAQYAFSRGGTLQQSNGDEALYSNFIGSFSKGLPHNSIGEVDPASYLTYVDALNNEDFDVLDTLAVGPRRLENPSAGVSYCLQGADVASIAMPPTPAFASAEEAGEIVELYWMALVRDISFNDYKTNSDIAAACSELSALSDFRGPKTAAQVVPRNLFRNPTPGDLAGPYISQLLLRDIPYGTLQVSQRQRTFVPNVNFVTSFTEWLAIQNGADPSSASTYDNTRRHIRNLRDLAAYVQVDAVYQAYLNAALILLAEGVPLKNTVDAYSKSTSQVGVSNFAAPHLLTLLGEVSIAALRTVWHQKWFVHRRLRPEAFAGHIQVHVEGQANYPIHPDALNSVALSRVFTQQGTRHLPMPYPEGSPRHPAYGAGHNSVAAACAAVLKSFFDETFVLSNPVTASADGTSLIPYTGSDVLTVGGEIDKLAGNIAQGRNAAGVHWRSDYTGSMPLGEASTEAILEDQTLILPEDGIFTYTRLDGSIAQITRPPLVT